MDGFKKIFQLIIAWSFVITFNRRKITLPPLTRSQLALTLRTIIEPQVQIYWFLYKTKVYISEVKESYYEASLVSTRTLCLNENRDHITKDSDEKNLIKWSVSSTVLYHITLRISILSCLSHSSYIITKRYNRITNRLLEYKLFFFK